MIDYLLILRKQQKFKQSYELCAQLVAQETDNMTYRFQQAVEDMQAGQTETAIQTVNEMIAAEPANPVLHILLGHLNKTHGANEAAAQKLSTSHCSATRLRRSILCIGQYENLSIFRA